MYRFSNAKIAGQRDADFACVRFTPAELSRSGGKKIYNRGSLFGHELPNFHRATTGVPFRSRIVN